MDDEEVWLSIHTIKDVVVSSHGRVMVIPRWRSMPKGGRAKVGGHPHPGQWDGQRFIYFLRGKTYKVARLVCEGFHGTPSSKMNVCVHLDEDSRNNRPENLRWATQRENLNMPKFLAYCRNRTGENSPTAKAKRKREAANIESA